MSSKTPTILIEICGCFPQSFQADAGIVGSNPTRGVDVCVRLFSVCVMCAGNGLATG
jgi:hypothetical protein